jgi:small-conductance mechanosensitive channel
MMLLQNWGEIFSQSLVGLWYGFIGFLPGLVGAIVLFLLGWLVGSVIGKVVTQIFTVLKVDKLFDSAGATDFMNHAGLRLNVSGFIGGLVKWFVIIVFLMAALQIVGLTQVNDFLREAVLYYLPKVIIASLVLVIATILADAMRKLVRASAQAANVRSAKMLGSITLYAIWGFALIIALSELGIATAFMQILFTGFIAALAIALGLSFGLGGKDAAARVIENVREDMSLK